MTPDIPGAEGEDDLMQAIFTMETDHCVSSGWETYMQVPPPRRRKGLYCAVFGHRYPVTTPRPANGFSPSSYACCSRCLAAVKFYAIGQHRFGGVPAEKNPTDLSPCRRLKR